MRENIEKNKKILKEIIEWTYCIIIAIILALIFRYYIGTPTVVRMSSMYNTLENGDRLILSRWTRAIKGKYSRGDIITFEKPSNPDPSALDVNNNNPEALYDYNPKGTLARFSYYILELKKESYIKRVIGVEGDHIKIQNGKVYLNEEELNEPYLRDGIKTESNLLTDFVVPEGYVFAMGDNREYSTDCRAFGCVPIERIESKVVVRFWPVSKYGKVD